MQDVWELALDLWSNEANAVEILKVDSIFEPIAGKFHANEIYDWGQENAFLCSCSGRSWDRLKIIRPNFFIQEDQV